MSQDDKPQLFTRTQRFILLGLVVFLVLGLALTRHRRLASAQPIDIRPGDAGAYMLRVDVNAASWQELAVLPGIGEAKAKAIVAERDANGPFSSTSDLDRVPGIGEKTIEDLSSHIRAGQGGE
jgi:competence protein ComEA